MNDQRVLSHGQWVLKGRVGTSTFVRGFSKRVGTNSYFGGTWEELEALCEKHFQNHEPGVGSVDGDVLLINLPPENFYTSIVEVTPENEHAVRVVETKRAEREAAYQVRVLAGVKPPAATAQVVVYRADVLAQDNDRSTDCEWEIVSINAGPGYPVPMAPTTMKRNEENEVGGTKRTYTPEEWAESLAFWETHVKVIEEA